MAEKTENTSQNTAEEVNAILRGMEKGDDGLVKLAIPEGTSAHVADLVRAEHKFRSTQSSYTKARQRTIELEAENEVLRGHVKAQVSVEEQERLDALKVTDPDAWHAELLAQKKPDIGAEARAKASGEFELERRVGVLEEFNEGRAVPITDDVVANDIPPRISNKLDNGSITFEEFLDEASEYLAKGKAVANPATMDQTDVSKVPGGDKPSKDGPATETGKYVDLAQSNAIL